MDSAVEPKTELTEKSLHNWQIMEVFLAAIERVFSKTKVHPTFSDPRRKLGCGRYLGLFLFGLFNPVVTSMRGLCSVSGLARVQREVCGHPFSLGSFSEMQAVVDPALLKAVFKDLLERMPSGQPRDARLTHLNVVVQDGSLWSALPRMGWAEYGTGPKGEGNGVRLHLRFKLVEDKPLEARITPGKSCERKALREMCVAGQTNVGDRYYGEDYRLFGEIDQAGGFFVFRIKEGAVIRVEEELPLSEADRAAGVVRQVWARLGARPEKRSLRLRLVEIQTADRHLLLVTNLPLERAAADLIGLIYRRRWTIELFFRWIKCILGCRHFFAESPEGVAIQLYLALIASLLFQFYTGHRPNKRQMELIQFFQMGWATEEDLARLFQRELAKQTARKKS